MFGVLLALALGVALYVIITRVSRAGDSTRNQVIGTLMAGYVLRLLLQVFLRDIPLFSHGVGGDNETYENYAKIIVLIWEHSGFEYITQKQLYQMGQTTLPQNLFALIIWANGGVTRIGCTSVVAFLACLTCFNLHELALELGGEPKRALTILVLMLFGPAFLMYTSEMYKDGLVAFFVISALASAFRLSRRLSVLHAVIGAASLFALWHVRYYLIFVSVGPMVVGLAGLSSKSIVRPLLAALLLAAAGLFVLAYTDALAGVNESIDTTLYAGTNEGAMIEKAAGGSGVTFNDGGNPLGQLHLKLAYTLFAPFPWQSGSVGLQIGKIDALAWYYLAYQAIRSGRRLLRENRLLLLMFLAFLVPMSIMYSIGMGNIGLSVRQRLPIVLVGALLAALRIPAASTAKDEATDDDEHADAENHENDRHEPAPTTSEA